MREAQKRGFDEILQPIVRTNFSQQPSAATAFAQMTAHLHREMAASSHRLDELGKAAFPVKLIWGDKDPTSTARSRS